MSLRSAKKQQTRVDILRATGALLAERGYEATTMRAIAGAANLSYQTLYNYYPTKGLVIQAVLMEDVGDVAAQATALIDGYQGNLLQTMSQLTDMRFVVVTKHDRALWREVVIDTLRQQAAITAVYREVDSASHEVVVRLLTLAQAHGELVPSVDVQLLSQAMFALSEFAFLEYVMNGESTASQVVEHIDAQVRLLVVPYLTAPA